MSREEVTCQTSDAAHSQCDLTEPQFPHLLNGPFLQLVYREESRSLDVCKLRGVQHVEDISVTAGASLLHSLVFSKS